MYKRFLVIICLFFSFSIFSITHNFFVTDLNLNSVSFIYVNGNSINNYEEKTIGFKFGDFKIIEINLNGFKIYHQPSGNIMKIDKNNNQETVGNDPFLGSDSNFIQSQKNGNNYRSKFYPGVYDESMLTPDMLKILKEKKFLVVPEFEAVAMSKLYRNTKYPYITIDSLYDAFFCLMSDFLIKAEICNKKLLKDFVNKLFLKLKILSENNPKKYLTYYRYISIPYIILNDKYEVAKDLFNKECSSYKDLILAYDNEENLSSYKPRGYYALEELKDYYVAMNFLGRKRFVINDSEDLEKIFNLIEVIQEEDLISIYEKIEGYYSFLNGGQDNNEILKILELKKDNNDLNEIFKNLKTSRIIDYLKDGMNEKEVKEFRLFGKRYVPESEVISSLFKINKKINAIDIMQLFGNKYAENIAKIKSKIPETDYDTFKKIMNKKENTLSYKLIDIMKSSFEADEKAKDIFKTDIYKAKMLNSSLSMWALKKRLFLLSEKESDQYIRGSISPLEFHGFVEPVPTSFKKIHETTEYIIRNLKELGFFYKKSNYYRFKYDFRYLKCFEILSKKAKDLSIIAQKQIDDEQLSEKDIKVFKGYDSFLRFIYQLNPSAYADDDMTKVASMYSNKEEGYVHNLGVGRAMPIFCLFPYKGKEYLTIGGILPFYEFNTTNHITDYHFTEMLDIKDKRLNFADWQKKFIYYKSRTRKKENTISLKEINDQKIKLFLNTLTNKETKIFYQTINEYFLRRVIYFRRSESHSRFIVDVIKKFLLDKSNDINKRVHLLETVNFYLKNELLVLLLDDLHRKLFENDIEIIKFISFYNLKNKENFHILKKLKTLNVKKFQKEYTLLNKKNKEILNEKFFNLVLNTTSPKLDKFISENFAILAPEKLFFIVNEKDQRAFLKKVLFNTIKDNQIINYSQLEFVFEKKQFFDNDEIRLLKPILNQTNRKTFSTDNNIGNYKTDDFRQCDVAMFFLLKRLKLKNTKKYNWDRTIENIIFSSQELADFLRFKLQIEISLNKNNYYVDIKDEIKTFFRKFEDNSKLTKLFYDIWFNVYDYGGIELKYDLIKIAKERGLDLPYVSLLKANKTEYDKNNIKLEMYKFLINDYLKSNTAIPEKYFGLYVKYYFKIFENINDLQQFKEFIIGTDFKDYNSILKLSKRSFQNIDQLIKLLFEVKNFSETERLNFIDKCIKDDYKFLTTLNYKQLYSYPYLIKIAKDYLKNTSYEKEKLEFTLKILEGTDFLTKNRKYETLLELLKDERYFEQK